MRAAAELSKRKFVAWGCNLGCDQTRDRAGRVGVEVETGALTLLEPEKRGAGDHRCVVGGKARARSENLNTLRLEPRSHRVRQGAVAGCSAGQYHARAGERIRGAPGFLD